MYSRSRMCQDHLEYTDNKVISTIPTDFPAFQPPNHKSVSTFLIANFIISTFILIFQFPFYFPSLQCISTIQQLNLANFKQFWGKQKLSHISAALFLTILSVHHTKKRESPSSKVSVKANYQVHHKVLMKLEIFIRVESFHLFMR